MAASGKQPFPIEDFSGGVTDNNFSGDMRSAAQMDNYYLTQDKKLMSRPGSNLDDAVNSPIPLGNVRVGKLINYSRNDKLFLQSAANFYFRPNADQTGAWSLMTGPSGNPVLTTGTTANFVSTSEWNKQMFIVSDAFTAPMKIYKDQLGAYQTRNVGMPALSGTPTVTPSTTGTRSYIYTFLYAYNYQVNTQSFIELGPTTSLTITNSSAPETNPNAITNIPVLSNLSGNNYDTSNVKVQIYRTINNGVNSYLVGTVTNGTTTFSDNVSDDVLQTNLQLYTNDGTLDYTQAPASKYVHVVGNIGYYGYTQDSFGPHPYRVHMSVPGNPGFVPQVTYLDLEDEVRGLGSVKALPIVFCKKIIYRIDGYFQSSGAGTVNAVKIHNSAGCISNESIVEAENWVFWAGLDGFYASDGYQVTKISDHLNPRYKAMVNASNNTLRMQGRFDEINRKVYFSCQTKPQTLDNDTVFVLDLRYGVSPNSTFTTFSGTSFKPAAIEIFNGKLYRGGTLGFVFAHDENLTTDPKVDPQTPASNWAKETIIWNYLSNQMNFGSSFMRKFVSRILLQAENAGNTSIQITAYNDQGKRTRALKPIRWKRNFTWGDEAFTWGNPDCIWDSQGLIEQWRRFPARGLRLSYLQIQITNAYSIVTTSDSDGLLTLNKSIKTVVLPNLWPSLSVDYVLYLSNDNYVQGYPVTAINTSKDTLTLSDLNQRLPADGTYEWELYGYEKGEPLNLLGYTLHWDNIDQNQNTYHTGDGGEN